MGEPPELQALRAQATALRDAAAKLEVAADALEGSPPEGATVLRGRAIIDQLDELVAPGEAVHYRDALRRLHEAGYAPTGKDPRNTLLTALTRSPYYSTTRSRTGIWRRHEPHD